MSRASLIVREIFRVIGDLRDLGVAILPVEPNDRAAWQLSDYGYVLETGEVALEGHSEPLEDEQGGCKLPRLGSQAL